ncbi:uncharacterized protein HMPREF1541_10387, partial [Cyphellophora europaea CBS 101466]
MRKIQGEVKLVGDEEAVEQLLEADYAEAEGEVDRTDPLGLEKGQVVEIWPTDSGSDHRDKGELVSINVKEVVLEPEVPGGKGCFETSLPKNQLQDRTSGR